MAIYHLSAKVIGRSSGRSSVAAAAYRSGGRLQDERQGIEHDYTRKGGVVHTEIMAPSNAPEWMRDRDQLWNAVEAVEKRKDAQLAREIEVSLPRELDRAEQLGLLRAYVQREFVDRGMIADLSVHETKARDGQGQPHAHVMLTMRELVGEGFGKKDRSWNAPDVLVGWREAWAHDANVALERAGRPERIDHRSLEAQREDMERAAEHARDQSQDELALECEKKIIQLDREPEPKLGPAANAQEDRGNVTERGEAFRAVLARNAARQEAGWRQLELRLELVERGRAFVAAARETLDQLWDRLEAVMSHVRERLMSDTGRAEPQMPEERDDLAARREAILGRGGQGETEREAPALEQDRKPNALSEQERRDAVLGRHNDDSPERNADRVKERDQDRER